MRELDTSTSKVNNALECLDAIAFIEGIQEMESIARVSLEQGLLDTVSSALDAIKFVLLGVKGPKPHYTETERKKVRPIAFVETVSCVFAMNGRSTIELLGVTAELDQYLLKNKINIERIEPYRYNAPILNALLREGDKPSYCQAANIWANGWRKRIEQAKPNVKFHDQGIVLSSFLDPFRCKDNVNNTKLPESIDLKIKGVCELFDVSTFTIQRYVMSGLLSLGLRHSLQYIIETCADIRFDIDSFPAFGTMSTKEASRLLGFSEKLEHVEAVLPILLKKPPKEIKKAFSEFGLKNSSCKCELIIGALGQYHRSNQFSEDQQESFMVVLSTVCRGLSFKSEDKALGARKALSEAGFSDDIQFQIPCIKKSGGEILLDELGV